MDGKTEPSAKLVKVHRGEDIIRCADISQNIYLRPQPDQRAVFSKCFANIKKAILHLSGFVGCNYVSPGGGTCQGWPTLTKHCKHSEFKFTLSLSHIKTQG